MNNREVADTLGQIAEVLELLGESSFRANAYRNAGRRIALLSEDVNDMAAQGRLTSIPGVGAGLAATVGEMLATGRSDLLEQLSFNVPPGLLDFLTVPGLGPRRARAAHLALGITTLSELESAARDGRLAGVPGFGPKTADIILKGLASRERWASRRLPADVRPQAEAALSALRSLPGVARAELAGSLRRRKDTVGDINLLVATGNPDAVAGTIAASGLLTPDGSPGRFRLHDGTPVTMEYVAPAAFGAGWIRATGSREHLAEIAQRGPLAETDTEEGVYTALGVEWIPPELREGRGEVRAAAEGRLPALIAAADLRGDLHMHSRYSDGAADIRDMALACIARGYSYMAITDHSQGLGIANGLTPERLREQAAEVEALNAELAPFRILRGNEVDIRADGSMDLPDEALAQLEWVIASVHSAFGRSREEQTARIERAMRNPYVNLVAHPTGRILGRRDGIAVDIDRLLETAAETGTALEINSGPDRLDLDDVNARSAKELGIRICINADAHHPEQLAWAEEGVFQARRAWLEAADVLNAGDLEAIQEFAARKRRNAGV
jgi:DNA polymerase (family 10)